MRRLPRLGIALVLLGCGSAKTSAVRDAALDGTPSFFDVPAGSEVPNIKSDSANTTYNDAVLDILPGTTDVPAGNDVSDSKSNSADATHDEATLDLPLGATDAPARSEVSDIKSDSVNTEGQGGQGGQGGQSGQGGQGGRGGQGGQNSNTGSISVPGGTRDLPTTHCTSTTGDGTCAIPSGYSSCIAGKCATSLTNCYYSDGVSSAVGGLCRSYANCMLACPCDTGQSKCEDDCLQNYAATDPNCWTCLIEFRDCSKRVNCPPINDCVNPERSPQLLVD